MVLLRIFFNGVAHASASLFKVLVFEEREKPDFLDEVTSKIEEEN